jgi:hypothetical protein
MRRQSHTGEIQNNSQDSTRRKKRGLGRRENDPTRHACILGHFGSLLGVIVSRPGNQMRRQSKIIKVYKNLYKNSQVGDQGVAPR